MLSPRERYLHDVFFYNLVNTLRAEIDAARFTPTEIREAAMLAQILYEQDHPRMASPFADLFHMRRTT